MASIMAAVAGVSTSSVAWSSSCRATPAAPLALTRSSFYGRVLTSSNPRTAVTVNVPLRIEAREPTKRESIKVRHRRIRKKLNGTTERPRLAVFRSNKHLYAQVIDDTKQSTLASSSTLKKGFRDELGLTSGPTVDAAKRIGEQIAQACLEKGIEKVAFDRGGFAYHGQIQALADAARAGGLNF